MAGVSVTQAFRIVPDRPRRSSVPTHHRLSSALTGFRQVLLLDIVHPVTELPFHARGRVHWSQGHFDMTGCISSQG